MGRLRWLRSIPQACVQVLLFSAQSPWPAPNVCHTWVVWLGGQSTQLTHVEARSCDRRQMDGGRALLKGHHSQHGYPHGVVRTFCDLLRERSTQSKPQSVVHISYKLRAPCPNLPHHVRAYVMLQESWAMMESGAGFAWHLLA